MKPRTLLGSALSAALVLSGACSDDPTPVAAPLEIGTLTSVSGDLASLGQEFSDATSLAIEDINAHGGVLDRPLKLLVEDDATTPDGARAGYAKLRAAKMPVILGPTTSAQVDAVIDLVASGNTLTIGRTTTADQLTNLPDNGFFYRLAPADSFQTRVLAQEVIDAGIEHLCLVHRKDIYGNNLAVSVQRALTASGKQVAVTVSDYNPQLSLSGIMAKCSALVCPPNTGDAGAGDAGGGGSCNAPAPEKVGLMLIAYIEDGALILDDAQSLGWSAKKQHFMMSDGAYDRSLLTRVKDVTNLEGAIGTSPSGPDPETAEGAPLKEFVRRYKARFGREPSIFVENAYDSMYAAAIAMEISGSSEAGPAIRDAMTKVSVPGGKKVHAGDWNAIRTAIRAGEAIDFEGASGNVDFDENGDVKPPYNYIVWKVQDGALVVAKRVSL